MLNLTRIRTEEHVRSLFLDSMNAVLPELRFRGLDDNEDAPGHIFEIRGAGKSFGRIAIEGGSENLPAAALKLIQDAVGMLEIMLENASLRVMSEREARLAEFQSLSGLGDWDWDDGSGRIRQSPQAAANLGLPPSRLSISLRDFLDCVHPEDREPVVARLRAGLASAGAFEYSFRVLWPNGQERTLAARAEAIVASNGAPVRVRGTTQDVTERKRLEEQLLQAQKLESVGRLAGGVAHDFNNLLTVINGYSELAISELEPAHPLRHSLEQIRSAGERATGLTRQLLIFSRRQVLRPRVLDLNEVVISVEKLMRRLIGEDIELRLHLGHGLGSVRVDPGQIEQVIMNLVVNSRDAMPLGGTLVLETCAAQLPCESARAPELPPGSYVILAVRDTGVGIDAQTRPRIFEPFFTTKEAGKGTGLGLSTVADIIRGSGGEITVESAPGKGAVFSIYLPCASEDARPLRAPAAAPPRKGRETVLLVEDEEAVRKLVGEMLTALGYTVLAASCGESAMQIFLDSAAGIQLLLTDAILPGMTGMELAQRLRNLRPGLKVLFMSGYPDPVGAEVRLLQKPVNLTELSRQVRLALDADCGAFAAFAQ